MIKEVDMGEAHHHKESKKKDDREVLVLKERERRKKKYPYVPTSMLDDESKARRRKHNREAVRRHREKMKMVKEVETVEANHQEESKKKEDGEVILLKRVRKKRKYIETSKLDEETKTRRRTQNREAVRRHREKKKITKIVDMVEADHQKSKKKEDIQLFLLKERQQGKKYPYVPTAMLDDESKAKRRKQNRESVQRHRLKMKKIKEVDMGEAHHHEEKKKKDDTQLFSLKEKELGKRKYIYVPTSMLDDESKTRRRKQNREAVQRHREKIKMLKVDIGEAHHHEEKKKKDDVQLFSLKENGQWKKKYSCLPTSMLDEELKARRRKQNKDTIRHYKEKETDKINASIEDRADIQWNYCEQKDEELYLLKERELKEQKYVSISVLDEESEAKTREQNRESVQHQRKKMKIEREIMKQKYVPISLLDEESKAKRRKQNREAVRRHREKKKTANKVVIIEETNNYYYEDAQLPTFIEFQPLRKRAIQFNEDLLQE